nr:hypothetical protein CFP56_03816 [Quercus suber]
MDYNAACQMAQSLPAAVSWWSGRTKNASSQYACFLISSFRAGGDHESKLAWPFSSLAIAGQHVPWSLEASELPLAQDVCSFATDGHIQVKRRSFPRTQGCEYSDAASLTSGAMLMSSGELAGGLVGERGGFTDAPLYFKCSSSIANILGRSTSPGIARPSEEAKDLRVHLFALSPGLPDFFDHANTWLPYKCWCYHKHVCLCSIAGLRLYCAPERVVHTYRGGFRR